MSISSPSRVLAYDSITQPFQAAFDQLATFLEDQVEHFEPEVRDLVRYCFGHSGKKLRPLLVFSAANYAGRDGWSGSILKAAAIVELVHLATLVHDDILDEATLRHRTETVASRYGPHVAVLLGDALFAHALHLASEYPSVEVCRSVSRATRQVCSGEIAQTFARESVIPDRAGYFRMIDLKTAELFRVSAYLGGFLSGMAEGAVEALVEYSTALGRAYQIYDDVADIFGEERNAGKTLGTDIATGKATLPIILWYETQSAESPSMSLADLLAEFSEPPHWPTLLTDHDVPRRCKIIFVNEIDRARAALIRLPDRPAEDPLAALLDFLEAAWNKFSVS
jgi:octaprenyl-diphosphate synthase